MVAWVEKRSRARSWLSWLQVRREACLGMRGEGLVARAVLRRRIAGSQVGNVRGSIADMMVLSV